MAAKRKREAKELAQTELMHGIGNVLGYWFEQHGNPERAAELGYTEAEFAELMFQQADRVARLFGFDKAWSN